MRYIPTTSKGRLGLNYNPSNLHAATEIIIHQTRQHFSKLVLFSFVKCVSTVASDSSSELLSGT